MKHAGTAMTAIVPPYELSRELSGGKLVSVGFSVMLYQEGSMRKLINFNNVIIELSE